MRKAVRTCTCQISSDDVASLPAAVSQTFRDFLRLLPRNLIRVLMNCLAYMFEWQAAATLSVKAHHRSTMSKEKSTAIVAWKDNLALESANE